MFQSRPLRAVVLWLAATAVVTAAAQDKKPTIAREGQVKVPVPEVPKPDPKAAQVPDGYRVEAVWTGLTYPTSVEIDAAGTVYVAEAGYSYGDAQAPAASTDSCPTAGKRCSSTRGWKGRSTTCSGRATGSTSPTAE